MVKKFGAGVSDAQIRMARGFEKKGITTYSQAIKAFQRGDHEQIAEWMHQLSSGVQGEEKRGYVEKHLLEHMEESE